MYNALLAQTMLAVPLWIAVATPGVSAALSGCQRCEQTGDCAVAYRGTPGQFCGHWLDRASQRQSCCCPVDAACRVSNYACNCHAVRSDSYAASSLLWLWWLLGALLVAAVCAGCVYALCAMRRRRMDGEDDGVPVAYPVQTPTSVYGANYGTAPPMYATPGYAAPVYGGGGGMGAGAGAALGGAAGLLGGVLLGEAIADAGDHGGGGFGDGGFDGFDSGDFGGDF